MKIKIGQLQSFIIISGQNPAIRFGVESAGCKSVAALENAPDFSNSRYIRNELWYETIAVLHLTDLFYDEKNGLFRRDGDISPLKPEHLIVVNNAHDLFFETYTHCKDIKPVIVDEDGRLQQAVPATDIHIAGHIKWLRFWINYAVKLCSKPVIANIEYIEIGKTMG